MLTGIRLGNFKAFSLHQTVPVRPITLIFGPNSAGKSSVVHSLALAHEANRSGKLDISRTHIGGASIDLGGFQQYVHGRQKNRRMEWGIELDVGASTPRIAELCAGVRRLFVGMTVGLQLDEEARPLRGSLPELLSYEIEADGLLLLRMSTRRGDRLQLDRLEHGHPLFLGLARKPFAILPAEEALDINELISQVLPGITGKPRGLFPSQIEYAESTQNPLGQSIRGMVDLLVKTVNAAVRAELKNFRYLGPLRSYPPRHLALTEHEDSNWIAGGGYAWDKVRRDDAVRAEVNRWLIDPDRLQTRYELRIRRFVSPDRAHQALSLGLDNIEALLRAEKGKRTSSSSEGDRFIDGWDRDAFTNSLVEKLAEDAKSGDEGELVLFDHRNQTEVSHRDVGIGISQVLPVLVSVYGYENKLIAIEQPEIHLHPRLQAEVSDVFIESALGERRNTLLLETHSEHLILRIMRRMRETATNKLPKGARAVRPDDVMVLYIEPAGSKSLVREMPLNERGELVKAWPGGFFEEGLDEVLS